MVSKGVDIVELAVMFSRVHSSVLSISGKVLEGGAGYINAPIATQNDIMNPVRTPPRAP